MEVPKAPTGWGLGRNFGMFSFEMVHFDAFWSTFRHYNCDYDVHDINRGLIMIMKITVCAMRTISTLK